MKEIENLPKSKKHLKRGHQLTKKNNINIPKPLIIQFPTPTTEERSMIFNQSSLN